MCFKSSKIAPSGPEAHPRLRPASRGLMGVVSLLWRHLATTYRPPLVRTPFVVPKTQSQVQRNTAGLQEEAEPPRRRHLRPGPAQEGRPDALLPFARGRVCTALSMPKNHGHGAHKESPIVPPVCITTSAWCIAIESSHLHEPENAIGSTQHINYINMLRAP
jgi:hypothetical protein